MTRGGWHAKAFALKADGLTQAEIAKQLGVTNSAVSKALHPERRKEYDRRQNAKPEVKARKRAWDRSEQGRGRCVDCGALKGAASSTRYARCNARRLQRLAASHELRDKQIEKWWNDGLKYPEIQARLGWTKGHLSAQLARLRQQGYNLPHRRSEQGLQNIRAANAANAARRRLAA